MGILGFLSKKEAQGLVSNALNAQKQKLQQSIVTELKLEQLDRAKADVKKWRDALEYWEDLKNPDRYEMVQLYNEIINDDSVANHMNTIIQAITGTEFEVGVIDAEGAIEPNPERTEALRGEWFENIVRYVIESELMGFTLVEVLPAIEGQYSADSVVMVPREHVIPEWGKVRVKPQQNDPTIDFTEEQFAKRLLQLGDKKSKGLFNNIALSYIYKKNSAAYWANFQSKFGIPPVVVKTDLTNTKGVEAIGEFLENMRSNTHLIVDREDIVEPFNMTNRDAYSTFKEFIKLSDEQIAKVLVGQTMTSEDGSSRSQAEVHERTAESKHIARLRRVERVVNTQLMPILIQDGLASEGDRFRFKEVKDMDSLIDRVVKLSDAGYKVDAKYLSELTGLPLTEVEAAPAPGKEPESVIKALDELYNSALCNC